MQSCNSLDDILQHVDTSIIQGYKTFMHEVIIQSICYRNLNFDTLNRHLLDFNKQAFDIICEKAISYYDMPATKDIKSFGN